MDTELAPSPFSIDTTGDITVAKLDIIVACSTAAVLMETIANSVGRDKAVELLEAAGLPESLVSPTMHRLYDQVEA